MARSPADYDPSHAADPGKLFSEAAAEHTTRLELEPRRPDGVPGQSANVSRMPGPGEPPVMTRQQSLDQLDKDSMRQQKPPDERDIAKAAAEREEAENSKKLDPNDLDPNDPDPKDPDPDLEK
jgi:hypothetical protein